VLRATAETDFNRSRRDSLALGCAIRVAERDAHQEAIQLGLRQRKRADLVQRILRCDHEERLRQRARQTVDRHLAFLHRFQQRALGLGAGPIDLIGQQHLGENWSRMKNELPAVAVVDRHTDHVRRQQVAGELDPAKRQAQGHRDRVRQTLADLQFLADDDCRDPAGAITDFL
jgi:hypothetical protein